MRPGISAGGGGEAKAEDKLACLRDDIVVISGYRRNRESRLLTITAVLRQFDDDRIELRGKQRMFIIIAYNLQTVTLHDPQWSRQKWNVLF